MQHNVPPSLVPISKKKGFYGGDADNRSPKGAELVEQVELCRLDLRYESCRMKPAGAEKARERNTRQFLDITVNNKQIGKLEV